MKILVTGANGMLGKDVCVEVLARHHDLIATDVDNLNILDRISLSEFIDKHRPDCVINCAAWTMVDDAQKDENFQKVFFVNSIGPGNIASVCKKYNCKLIHISTDYVFSGEGENLWKADDDDYHPLNIYGMSKFLGEQMIINSMNDYFIVRTSWLYGKNGKNFVDTMLNLAGTHKKLKVVNDQIGRPTYTVDLARLLLDMAQSEKYGIYHACGEGEFASWCNFAKEIFRLSNYEIEVDGVSTSEYGKSLAKRPLNSRLDTSKLLKNGFRLLPDWKESLKQYIKQKQG